MNWIDEKVKEFELKYGGVAYPFVEGVARTQEEAIADIRTALTEAKAQGAQEALAKVNEWLWNSDYKEEPAVDLLHYLQQLKDNKV